MPAHLRNLNLTLNDFRHTEYSESALGVAPWWPPKRDFGGTPLSTDLSTKLGLPSVRCRQWKKYGYLDRRKTELEYILLSYC